MKSSENDYEDKLADLMEDPDTNSIVEGDEREGGVDCEGSANSTQLYSSILLQITRINAMAEIIEINWQ